MQFPESWLREYCNPNLTTQQLADTMSGTTQVMTMLLGAVAAAVYNLAVKVTGGLLVGFASN